MKKIALTLILAAAIPFSLSVGACSTGSEMAQMDHGSTGDSPDAMPMNHSDSAMSMDLGPADETFDLRFIDAMKLHHQGAIDMAQEALEKSDRPEIQQLAQEIIAAQEQEIQELETWRQAWYTDAGAEPVMYHAEMGHSMPMTEQMQTEMKMAGSLGEADAEFDLRFIDAMIPHHEGALVMAEEAQAKSDRPEIQTLAQNIIASQQQEIDQMQQWRQAWYGK